MKNVLNFLERWVDRNAHRMTTDFCIKLTNFIRAYRTSNEA